MDCGHRFNFELTTMAAHHKNGRASILLSPYRVSCFRPRLREHSGNESALSHSALDCLVARTTAEQYWNSSPTRPVRLFTVSRVCSAVATHAATLFRWVTVHRYAASSNVQARVSINVPFTVRLLGTIFCAAIPARLYIRA